jgi:DNA-binding MarR family transcriptional regulator
MNQNHCLMNKLFRFEMLMHRYQAVRFRAFGPFGNPLRGQGRILSILKLQPQISQKDLSYMLDMRQQSLSELLVKLENAGLITRKPSEDDHRVVMITLTEQGKAFDAQPLDPEKDDLLGCLSAEEQAQLGDMLDRLTRSLEQGLANTRPELCGRAEHHRGHRGDHFHEGMHGWTRRGGRGSGPQGYPDAPDEE